MSEQIAVWSIIHDKVRVAMVLDDVVKRNDSGMGRGELMQYCFADVQVSTG